MLRDLITDKLELADDVVFDHVHCLSSKPNSPVIARCAFSKDKVKILKVKLKLQGSNIFIGEDFCARVRDIRRKLTPHLMSERDEGCRVSIVFDHLLVDRNLERGSRWTIMTISRRLNRKFAALATESNLDRFMTRLVRAMLSEHIAG